jgi:LEA14-like dessication related protein
MITTRHLPGRILTSRLLLATWFATVFPGCAMLQPDLEEPRVEVAGLRMLPMENNTPEFEIDLRVINPNDHNLSLRGISYTINIEERDLVTGVANNLPEIPAYGEATITLTATLSVLEGIRLITDLLQRPRDKLNYAFNAQLDLGAIMPDLTISETGVISLAK